MMELRRVTIERNGDRNGGRKGRTVLDEVAFTVPRGELWAVVGPNGSGKSSLLLAMAGLLRPGRGEVRLLGERLEQWPRQELAMRLGFLPQSPSPSFPYTVRELVEMGRVPWLRRYGKDRARDDAAVDRALAAMGLHGLAERTLTNLSGGEQQRASLAQVLAQETPLVLLDEPLAHLDLLHQTMLLRRLRDLREEGRSAVFSVHDLSLAWRWCDRLLITGGGRARVFAARATAELEECMRSSFGLRFRFDEMMGPIPAELTELVLPRTKEPSGEQ